MNSLPQYSHRSNFWLKLSLLVIGLTAGVAIATWAGCATVHGMAKDLRRGCSYVERATANSMAEQAPQSADPTAAR